ncbi:hypothetical protein [Micromonospora sp. CA-244673]|uniref:hypothetical protein n=1 Tax=Micromonospora sp. CA-244673 TaxID=3239958 RepID=UPI003D8A6108
MGGDDAVAEDAQRAGAWEIEPGVGDPVGGQAHQPFHERRCEHGLAVLSALDLPALLRRWQVRLTLSVLVEVTATGREDAFDAAEAAVETALTAADVGARFEWDGSERDGADAGDVDPTADEPAELG